MGNSGVLAGVGWTALVVAAARAVETARPDGLVDDPFAAQVVRAAGSNPPLPLVPGESWPSASGAPDAAADEFWRAFSTYVGVRSSVFDDALRTAVADGAEQVVLLAAGLDARAYRIDWPADTRVVEIDTAGVLEAKEELFGAPARGDRRAVPVDLRDDWPAALQAAGFDAARPSAWLAEGLLAFLPAEAQELLFARIAALAAPGSSIAVEHFGPFFARVGPAPLERLAAPWGIDVPPLIPTDQEDRPHPAERLAADGWEARTLRSLDVAAALGRSVDVPGRSFSIDTDLVIARRSA